MFLKPKKSKQLNIQDRQPPRTLQELIDRYDLDNTKIYKFLDELVNELNKNLNKSSITYDSWHNIVLTRADSTYIDLMLYGSNTLKEGKYSIKNSFKIETIGTINATLTVPLSAIQEISRKDWGFEILLLRSEIIEDIHSRTSREYSNDYNGIAIIRDGSLTLMAT